MKLTEAQKQLRKAQQESLKAAFETLWRQLDGPELEAEYRFHPVRRFRFDFCHLPTKTAVELEGGTRQQEKTGHTTGDGYRKDCIKYNLAALLNWTVFRLTSDMLTQQEGPEHLQPIIDLMRAGSMPTRNERKRQ